MPLLLLQLSQSACIRCNVPPPVAQRGTCFENRLLAVSPFVCQVSTGSNAGQQCHHRTRPDGFVGCGSWRACGPHCGLSTSWVSKSPPFLFLSACLFCSLTLSLQCLESHSQRRDSPQHTLIEERAGTMKGTVRSHRLPTRDPTLHLTVYHFTSLSLSFFLFCTIWLPKVTDTVNDRCCLWWT